MTDAWMEAAACRTTDVDVARAIREGLNELEVQCSNAGTTFAVLLVRRRGGKWAAVMPLEMFCTYAREALQVAA